VAQGRGLLTASELRTHTRADSSPNIQVLDLSVASFVDPAGLVALAAIAERASDDGRHINFTAPLSPDCASYLSRMRLGQYLTSLGVTHELPPVRENPLGDRLNELKRFTGEDEYEELAGTVERTFRGEHPVTAKALYRAVHEIASNVIDHSGRTGGFLALQRFRQTNTVAFAVADSGIGLRASLSGRYTISTDAVALARAAQTHVSAVDDRGRGRGIGRVIAITGQHAGEVILVSGTSQGSFTRGSVDPRVENLAAGFPGTLAQARLSVAHSTA
jgi:anti-anti-sigma regulatory factor